MMKFSLNHLNQSTSIKLKSISKKIVEEHGGNLEYEGLGDGSKFTVYLNN